MNRVGKEGRKEGRISLSVANGMFIPDERKKERNELGALIAVYNIL